MHKLAKNFARHFVDFIKEQRPVATSSSSTVTSTLRRGPRSGRSRSPRRPARDSGAKAQLPPSSSTIASRGPDRATDEFVR